MKKLSPAQQKVVDCLRDNDAYIVRSKYYNHNRVNSRIPITSYDFEYYCLMQFPRPTFDVLLREGIIEHTEGEHQDIYNLVKTK